MNILNSYFFSLVNSVENRFLTAVGASSFPRCHSFAPYMSACEDGTPLSGPLAKRKRGSSSVTRDSRRKTKKQICTANSTTKLVTTSFALVPVSLGSLLSWPCKSAYCSSDEIRALTDELPRFRLAKRLGSGTPPSGALTQG